MEPRRLLWCGVAILPLHAAALVPYANAQTPPAPSVQGAPSAPAAPAAAKQALYTKEQLDQMLAPIALYPDALLTQVLMAATYPLEVVEASRWSKANPKLKGDAAIKAVETQNWDVSVKSLVAFPQVLHRMDSKLDWTQKLGDAMLAQQPDVAASIQRLRDRAHKSGKLKSDEHQNVTTEPASSGDSSLPQVIIIEPAEPQTVYVPVYDPWWMYDPWFYPSYPPVYYPPWPDGGYERPPHVSHHLLWGAAIVTAAALYSRWNWSGGDVNINIDRAANIDRNFNRGDGGRWQHKPEHRRGVAYRDNASRERFGTNVPGAVQRQEFRGKAPTQPVRGGGQGGAVQRPAGGQGAAQRPGGGTAAQRPAAGAGAGVGGGQRPGGSPVQVQRGTPGLSPGASQGGAFDGIDRANRQLNREYGRGSSSYGRSMGSGDYGRGSGGGYRGGYGGGGGRMGGGGGRGGGGGGRGGGGRR